MDKGLIYRSGDSFIIECLNNVPQDEKYILLNIAHEGDRPLAGFAPAMFLKFMPYDDFKEYHIGDDLKADAVIKRIVERWGIAIGDYFSDPARMSVIKVRKIGITEIEADAIVNAANEGLQAGGGVCGAIFKAAGRKKLQDACDMIGHCGTGKAVITPGFESKAKYIIHAVGPRWQDGKHHEPQLLYCVYQSAMTLAVERGCGSIVFPLISAGIYGYPKDAAIRKAIQAIRDFLKEHEDVNIEVIFAIPDETMWQKAIETLHDQAPEYEAASIDQWKTKSMPEQNAVFSFKRAFTKEQMQILRRGNVPKEMEDKWFWCMEGNKLYAFRSWTGYCLYIMEFCPDNLVRVTVNRDPEQYLEEDIEKDARNVNELLDWWTASHYDYRGEWLAETAEAIRKSDHKSS